MLKVRGLSGKRVSDLNFDLAEGEILGVAGLLGSGRSELGRLLFGAQVKTSGTISIGDSLAEIEKPADGLRYGIGYVPEDRLGKGGIGSMTLRENLTLPRLTGIWTRGGMSRRNERIIANSMIVSYRIRPNDPEAKFSSLSGGNQQKAIIARSLRLKPRLLILDEPVQGVDIGSKVEIFELIEEVARSGTSVLVIDSEFGDLCRLCNRVLVLHEGRLVGEVDGSDEGKDRIVEIIHTRGGRG